MDYQKVIDVVKEAKKIVLNDDLRNSVKMKGEADFVTEVDLQISQFIHEKLTALYPEIGFMSEEEEIGELPPDRWILDPIDGTTNLVFGYNMSSISLALLKANEIVFGVVYNPFNDELFTAEKGKGAMLNGAPIHCKDRQPVDSLIEFGAGSTRKKDADESFGIAKEIFKGCLDIRRICSSALAICFVACGRTNGYFEKKLKPWDYAAGGLILTEAGGVITDWDGTAVQYDRPQGLICGSPVTCAYIQKTIENYGR